jgi:hydrogenase maturation protease
VHEGEEMVDKESPSEIKRKVVLGLGNTLQRDDGLGVHALRVLETQLGPLIPGAIEFLDGGTLGLNLLPIVEEASHLLILDAVDANQPPGIVIELRREQIPLYTGIKLSEHQATFQEVLGLANFRGKLPEHLHLLGIQPADVNIGIDLSPMIAAILPQLVERAINVLVTWGLLEKTPVAGSGHVRELQE